MSVVATAALRLALARRRVWAWAALQEVAAEASLAAAVVGTIAIVVVSIVVLLLVVSIARSSRELLCVPAREASRYCTCMLGCRETWVNLVTSLHVGFSYCSTHNTAQ